MTRGDAFGFRLAAVVAVAIGLFGAVTRTPPATAPRFAPLFDPAAAGPRPVVRPAAERLRADRAAAMDATFAAAAPAWAKSVVLHPFVGEAPPEGSAEDGPPYHLVVGRGGALTRTRRLDAGMRATPPGAPREAAVDALHVAVTFATTPDEARDLFLREWWAAAARRLKGTHPVRFVFELPGSDATAPAGFDASRWTASAEDLAAPAAEDRR